jgi:hypothetical protein
MRNNQDSKQAFYERVFWPFSTMYFCAIDIYASMCIMLIFLVDKVSPGIYSTHVGISVILIVSRNATEA